MGEKWRRIVFVCLCVWVVGVHLTIRCNKEKTYLGDKEGGKKNCLGDGRGYCNLLKFHREKLLEWRREGEKIFRDSTRIENSLKQSLLFQIPKDDSKFDKKCLLVRSYYRVAMQRLLFSA